MSVYPIACSGRVFLFVLVLYLVFVLCLYLGVSSLLSLVIGLYL